MTEEVQTKGKVRQYTEAVTGIGKDIVALLRDSILFIFAVLLLIFPAQFNSVLTSAGFEEGSFAGLKWKKQVAEANGQLEKANVLIERLDGQNKELVGTVTQIENRVDDPALKNKVADIRKASTVLSQDTTAIQNSVQQTIVNNAALLAKSAPAFDEKYVVVFGGDAKLEDAKYEAETAAPKLGIPNATINLKRGFYRAVVITNSRSEADAILSKVSARRSDAYVVRLSTWCPNVIARNGYSECTD